MSSTRDYDYEEYLEESSMDKINKLFEKAESIMQELKVKGVDAKYFEHDGAVFEEDMEDEEED